MTEQNHQQPMGRFWKGCPIWFQLQREQEGCALSLRNVGWRDIVFLSLVADKTTYEIELSLAPQQVYLWHLADQEITSFCPVLIRFADGVEWCNAHKDEGFPVSPTLLPDAKQPYYEEFAQAWADTEPLYMPCVTEHYWGCGCGQVNDIARTFCGKCGKNRQWVKEHLDGITCHATAQKEQALLQEQQIRAARKANMDRLRRKKWTRLSALALGGAVLLTGLICLIRFVMIPGRHYAVATAYMDLDRYCEAYDEYTRAGNFKDSKEKLVEISRRLSAETCISAGYRHTVRNNLLGKVDGTGYALDCQLLVSKWNAIRALSAGKDHTLGLHYSGTVMAVGNEDTGATNVKNWVRVVAIGAGDGFSVGLQDDGKVLAVGKNNYGQCNVKKWSDITAIAVGADFVLGLKSDGTVVATGNNQYGQCDVSQWKDIIFITAGGAHALGLKSDGTVVAAGRNDHGEKDVSHWTQIMTLAAGDGFTVGVRYDGTLIATGKNDRGQIKIDQAKDMIAVTCGWDYTVAVQKDGKVQFFGTDEDGEGIITHWDLGL